MYIASKSCETIQNGQREVTVKHTKTYLLQRNGAKYSESKTKNVEIIVFI